MAFAGTHRSITKQITASKALIVDFDDFKGTLGGAITEDQFQASETLLITLQQKSDKLTDVFAKYETLLTANPNSDETTLFEKHSEDDDDDTALIFHHNAINRAITYIRRFQERYNAERNPATLPTTSTRSPSAEPRHHVKVSMEHLTFNGTCDAWLPFWQQFHTNVDMQSLPLHKKLQLLLNCLRDEALAAVRGFAVIDVNYTTVTNILKETYGNPNDAINVLVQRLNNLPYPSNDFFSIQSSVYDIRAIVCQLRTMKQDVDSPFIINLVESKLHVEIRANVLQRKEDVDGWNMDIMQKTIDSQLKIQRSLSSSSTSENRKFDSSRNFQYLTISLKEKIERI